MLVGMKDRDDQAVGAQDGWLVSPKADPPLRGLIRPA
jgi:hypothetical protein